ncbi:MAG: sigma-70 family RNA polymerase sigma factor [Deltaproteobacteria bacterium]|nr:sigma-70 family RNA polymerase sigma factor [Deltaproteobacteria bacterium]
MLGTASSAPGPRFRELYRAHYGFVWHTARRFGVEEAQLDDAVQDTFVTAYRRIDGLRETAPRPWLYAIARRIASNYRRSGHRRGRRHEALRQQADAGDRATLQLEALHTLETFSRELSDVERELFVLSEVDGMSGGEIASTLSMPASTVYDRVRALRARFQRHVADGDVTLARARGDRPRASAKTWALLLMRLPRELVAAPASSWAATLTAAKFALGTAVVVVGLAAVVERSRASAPSSARTASATTQGNSRAQTVDAAPLPPPTIGLRDATPTSSPAARDTRSSPAGPRAAMPPLAAPSRPSTTSAAPTPAPASTPDDAHPPALDDETRWLREGTTALARGDAAHALALTERHAASFPDSALADVRDALKVDALCALGRADAARREAAALWRRRPDSPVAARVRDACSSPP